MITLMVGLFTCLGAILIILCISNSLLAKIRNIQAVNQINTNNVSKNIPLDSKKNECEVINSNKQILFQTDNWGRWTFLNPVWTEITGFTIAESIGTSFLNYIHPEDRQRNLELFEIIKIQQIKDYVYETRYISKDGDCRWLEVDIEITFDSESQIVSTFGFLKDISSRKQDINALLSAEDALETVIKEKYTPELQREISERKRVQKELEKSLSLQQATLESTADGILVVDNKGNITGFNQKFVQMWCIPDSLMVSGNYRKALKMAIKELQDSRQYLATVRELYLNPDAQIYDAIAFKDGRVFERYSQPQRIAGKIVGRVWSFRDVTAHKLAEAKIRHQALHDLLTDLPNRVLFNERLSESLAQAREKKEKLAVCFLDLDRFKTINDTLGHALGDKLLQSVAQRLTKYLRSSDFIARWGGDEFTLLFPEINDAKEAAYIVQHILAALKPEFDIENHHLHISASIGIALYPMHGEDGETLIKNADAALSRVKSQGRNNYQFYHSAINSQASELLSLENSLHYALEREEFIVYYQPQINISTGEIIKMEALLRWQHPKLGLIYPEKFIPLAEETGLIVTIGEWVLKTACAQNKAWQDTLGLPSLSIAVNLSARQFQQSNLVKLVTQILLETQLNPKYLELEITESIAMHNAEFTKAILNEINNMGVYISIDDFGTGYCSFNYLKKFPIHALKIDKSFVRDLTKNSNDAAIITAIIALAHGLNLAVVGEGVETEEQRNLLRILECELMQGYFFSRPVLAEDATKLLRKSKSRRLSASRLVA
ncbi:EAL domain-containing protein [Hassallia byssoidea VB512170]|uniref:EAL domain-containing protein n=1 Tax=Hassallia byssoidea VB512170 TaxID=1304833 RepID=A0A846HCF2_9CYAN|nr:EAL domain-containing protein [Hassalia byssoidea]NEU74091.1 EAL domain-containing protein [Hassalia byssoidea VB512170]